MLLQASLNGGWTKVDHPAVPMTIAEISAESITATQAGAQLLHIHIRDAAGKESLQANDVAAMLNAVRAAAPNTPVGISTGAWIEPNVAARLHLIKKLHVLPDYASVNINEEGSYELVETLIEKGIGVEAGIWNAADAVRYIAMPAAARCLRIMLEIMQTDPDEAFAEYRAVMDVLRDGPALPIMLHGNKGAAWAMLSEAAARGYASRIGLEDTFHLPNGDLAAGNGPLVATAAAIYRQHGLL